MSGLTGLIDKNIRTLVEARLADESRRSLQSKIADKIGVFAGSLPFVYLHALIFGLWLLINSGALPLTPQWDPYPFVMLAMIASVEAIFLSTFVLINQNRTATVAQKRADLDLQISLLTEHELTRLIQMTEQMMVAVGVADKTVPDLEDIKKDVPAEAVMERLNEVETN